MRSRAVSVLVLFLCLAGTLFLGGRPAPADDDARPRCAARVTVKGDGFVRITGDALARVGIDTPTVVEVRRLGRRVPVCTTGPARDLVFLAHDVASPYSAYGVFELWVHAQAAPRGHLPASGSPSPSAADGAPAPLFGTRRYAPDRVHGPLAAAEVEVYAAPRLPSWFVAWIPASKSLVTDLDPAGAAAGHPQTLRVTLYGTQPGPVDVSARWGGADLGVASSPTAAGGTVLSWAVPADAVPTDDPTLELRDLSPPPPAPPPQDVTRGRGTLWIDALELEGRVEPTVGGGLSVFDLPPNEPVTLEPSTPAGEIFLVRVAPSGASLGSPVPLEAKREHAAGLRLDPAAVPTGTRLFASTHAREEMPTVVEARPDPLGAAGMATHVILAVPELLEPARRLARHRTATGTPSAVIPVRWVYDLYGAGEHDPAAIRAFVQDLAERDLAPLDFLVLAGDATLDRTDMAPFVTIPAPLARTLYNGATAADRLYTVPSTGPGSGGPSVGRLPFRETAEMERYVERLIAYETRPPAHDSRRLMRFVTSEARFGPLIDGMIERMFRIVVTQEIPPAYDLEVTFASASSPYLWPPSDFNARILHGFNEGCLFYTYVGHGFAEGFDSLRVGNRRFPILHATDVPKVACEGTPPVVFVIACTTAIFDRPSNDGVGEALLKNPQGPIAYWGATRICHPAANSLLGRAIARYMAKGEGTFRLGQILDRARDQMLDPTDPDPSLPLIKGAIRMLARGVNVDRLLLEGSWMYELLGDPATRLAFPRSSLAVEAAFAVPGRLETVVRSALPDGTEIHLALEVTRDRRVPGRETAPVSDPLDPALQDTIRDNHRNANDLALARSVQTLAGGEVRWATEGIEVPAGWRLVVKASAIAEGDVHQGAAILAMPEREPASERDGPEAD